MDKTELYIQMSDCPEIQGVYEPDMTEVFFKNFWGNSNGGVIWLPRRDQLQDMSGLGWEEFDDKCFLLAGKYLILKGKECSADEIAQLVSKEQAGIMVVMHELYNKKWDGREWV